MEAVLYAIFWGIIYVVMLWIAVDEPGIITFPSLSFSIIISGLFLFTKIGWQLIFVYWTVLFIIPIIVMIKKAKYKEEKKQQEYLKRKEEERRVKEYRQKVGDERFFEEERERQRRLIDSLIDKDVEEYKRRLEKKKVSDIEEKCKEYKEETINLWEQTEKEINYKYYRGQKCRDGLKEINS